MTELDATKDSAPPQLAGGVTRAFLQAVIDAFPDCMLVIEPDYGVVLANRASRDTARCGRLAAARHRCYEVFHRRDAPCGETCCPLREVIATKAPVRVVHTHYDTEGRPIVVEISAAPVFNQAGEVVQIVETCRDITERRLSRRLLEIGNRHMEMTPLLAHVTDELRSFTGCAAAGIRVLDEGGDVAFASHNCGLREDSEERAGEVGECLQPGRCVCLQWIDEQARAKRLPSAEPGSFHTDRLGQLLPASSNGGDGRPDDPSRVGGCQSLALVPIPLGDRVLGLLYVADPRPNLVRREIVESLERLAVDLGAVIQRVQSEEALQRARCELETRVRQRTAELTQTNEALQEEIAERARLEREILQVSAKEQQRIGQELHDGLGQELTGLSYLAQSLYQKLKAKTSPETETASELARGIPLAIRQIQRIVEGLIPHEIGADSLPAALEALAANVQERMGVACRFEDRRGGGVKDDDNAIQMYRIAQEAITNAIKHAQSRQIVIALKGDADAIRLEVRDDGVGIGPSAQKAPGCGLRTMRHRARAIGAALEIKQADGGGTVVACVLPTG